MDDSHSTSSRKQNTKKPKTSKVLAKLIRDQSRRGFYDSDASSVQSEQSTRSTGSSSSSYNSNDTRECRRGSLVLDSTVEQAVMASNNASGGSQAFMNNVSLLHLEHSVDYTDQSSGNNAATCHRRKSDDAFLEGLSLFGVTSMSDFLSDVSGTMDDAW